MSSNLPSLYKKAKRLTKEHGPYIYTYHAWFPNGGNIHIINTERLKAGYIHTYYGQNKLEQTMVRVNSLCGYRLEFKTPKMHGELSTAIIDVSNECKNIDELCYACKKHLVDKVKVIIK